MEQLKPLKYFDSLYPDTTRQKELSALIPYIEKGLSAQVVGLAGVGKSNILRLLSYNRDARFKNYGDYEKWIHFVYIDSSEVKNKSLFDIIKFILLSLSFSLGERRMIEESKEIDKIIAESIAPQDEMVLFHGLKRAIDYLSIEKKLSVFLLFDKFDTILPNLSPEFFTDLRILRNHAKYRFGSVFALTRPIEDTAESSLLADFSDLILENIIYTTLYDKVGIDFRISYIENAARKTFPEEVKNEIVTLSGGHAKLTKLSIESLISEEQMPENVKDYLLKRPTIQAALQEIWATLLPSEQMALKKEVSSITAEGYPYLINSGLVAEGKIAIPFFEEFVKNISVSTQEKITYDESRNEILKGTTPLSDKLSASEFRLLKYLIENKEKLCTKDEIINSVWKDQRTQEGVTDQALDQIFYRLRKKVEVDPSNPRYIQTVKGQGYKLND